ncbi:DNA/RNA polymerase [Rhizoclosmatium globosum]|uniref:DNA polymerase n=1 Tax=Rhizoclosmatium globosum TaxID=329046 RepID=A0A1Y2CIC3_9FUNG|nr:DNA/RNA polymerase [Rhizoclosmatium globosum]|eukprot:ORY46574.1 DNA/RNA polymerase [Rhizoclosmatium globosum]
MSVEILTHSMRESDRVLSKLPKIKLPDPAKDSVKAVFYCFQGHDTNCIGRMVDARDTIQEVETELELYECLLLNVREFDPDILLGYEVHLSSWGYLIERAKLRYKYDFLKDLSRMEFNAKTKFGRDQDPFSYKDTCAISCTGRIFLNVWRLMRGELTLTNYSLENCVFHVLHERIPKFTPSTLYAWFDARGLKRWRALNYYLERVQYTLDLLDDTSFISRSCHMRGSQFRVESIMSRITRPENFVSLSPTKEQVRKMRAIEFYKNPMAVLDFQSLYPSVMIGYNICYSTCLGRLRDLGDHLYITHNGVIFVKSYVREGVLGRMLTEILETRVMVKTAMKAHKTDTGLLRILEARQLCLKLVANVTYGYAGASYSGRMPCAEIADSIVETGRRSLEAAMKLVDANKDEWGGTVVYGDTDSMFVELPGKSLESAFRIGIGIANRFEKIYLPCILLAKKRYVGFMYETLEDKVPVFDAKGIETVRRDGFPAMAKIVEDSLKILFRTQDMSELKAYLYRQWDKIMSNRVALNDLIIATEFKLKNYRNVPPGVALCIRSMEYDKRTEPQAGERIPYIICKARNTRYSGRSYTPLDVVKDRTLRPDGTVYVTKSVQALSRIFKLIGIDVESWFNMMPKKQVAVRFANPGKQASLKAPTRGQFKIDQFYQSNHCVLCNELTANDVLIVCDACKDNTQQTLANLLGRLSEIERKRDTLQSVCRSCSMQSAGMNLQDSKARMSRNEGNIAKSHQKFKAE